MLGAGGTIAILAAGGARLRLIAVTDGEASHPEADPAALARQEQQVRAAVIGRDVRISGHPFTVVGVARDFRGLDRLLSEETGLTVRRDADPLTCVVRGTGRILDDFPRFESVLTT